MSTGVRSKARLWAHIKGNIRLNISVMVAVGSDELCIRNEFIREIGRLINLAIPRYKYHSRRDIEVCEIYQNGYLHSYLSDCHNHSLVEPVDTLTPLFGGSYILTCDVSGSGESSRTISQYQYWKSSIFDELILEYGPAFVGKIKFNEPLDLPDRNLACPLIEEEPSEDDRLMVAEMLAGSCGYEMEHDYY